MLSILSCFILALIPSAASITFNFPNISQKNSQDIILSGDAAYATDDGIHVTYRNVHRSWEGLAGRATYIRPLHLWDNDSTYLASFSTSYTFVIKSCNENAYGDGLTFFLAQNNSVINAGGSMGLPFTYQDNKCLYPFVAVEYDTYGTDEWDPYIMGDHVGINVNSLTSVVFNRSIGNINNGIECRAFINYNSDSKNFSVSFTGFENNLLVWEITLNYTIDLRKVLPEWVIFGFSASTGDGYEINKVRSWVFNSTVFKGEEINGLAPTENVTQSSSLPPTNNINPSSNTTPTKNNDQSSSLPLTTTKNVGKVGLLAGTLVIVFNYMVVL